LPHLGVLLGWAVRSLWVRRSSRKQLERGLDHLAHGEPYVIFDFHQGPIVVHTQDGDIVTTLPLGPGSARLAGAIHVLEEHGWQKVGSLAMSDLDTLFVPVTHHPVRNLLTPHAQGEL